MMLTVLMLAVLLGAALGVGVLMVMAAHDNHR
jgi:hypothetical protein